MSRTAHCSQLRAVIFDLGGVVLGSPLHAIADYEREHGLPAGAINRHVAASSPTGAWHRLERGEITMGEDFLEIFATELATAGLEVDTAEMMQRIAAYSTVRPEMITAIDRLGEAGYLLAALTNNWAESSGDTDATFRHPELQNRFDHVIESRKVGLRKPDPAIYELTCRTLSIEPNQAVFLDDIGANLKTARALGLVTIKVDDPRVALTELGEIVGLALLD